MTEEPRPIELIRKSIYSIGAEPLMILGEAIDELEALRADNRRLREALETLVAKWREATKHMREREEVVQGQKSGDYAFASYLDGRADEVAAALAQVSSTPQPETPEYKRAHSIGDYGDVGHEGSD